MDDFLVTWMSDYLGNNDIKDANKNGITRLNDEG
jgi:hypothetical protein